jgi:hypothetical protein
VLKLLWYIGRTFYMLFFWFVAVLFWFVFFGTQWRLDDLFLLMLCMMYFALGGVMFWVIPKWLRGRLMRKVTVFAPPGFKPQWAAVSVMFNRYMGLDPKINKVIFMDVDDGTKTLMALDDIASWELKPQGSGPLQLTFFTRLPTLPVICVCIPKREALICEGHLRICFMGR